MATTAAPPPGRVFSSPLARRLARAAGLVCEEIPGTGPGGRVVRRDVLAAVTHRRRRRDTVACPALTLRGPVPVGDLLDLRHRLNEVGGVPHVSLTHLLVRAAALAHRAVPSMRAGQTAGTGVRPHTAVDLALAVATERGLVTPVLRDADRLPLTALADAVVDLVRRARADGPRPGRPDGATLTLVNLGGYGVEEATVSVTPPRSAVLAVGAARPEAVVVDGRVRVETVLRATLSVDPRAVDGAVAAAWLREFTALLEQPVRLLL
ncbi:Dihydrolipoyllysine-residue acetyltransferase component of pyruvate dehydrogenase complex (plasmid) [Streptomyces sp. YIM 121038]|uniref:2-oxo acid dehydrogenase subunit E2 n=1 Tax=Streptomyces sp. YIM 121038 TaxID=2136401 RepID=UPI001110985F|nr:2-oxo acid dehydrogenase subunit E2 [Streptomyces sp. YIM 121038]QCX82758.1 Dihydrolipoyllysine-residue acetyltransferase component of pyruvate dehydrogenase complex [Streptomyces sp. YIM 121038]